LLPLFPAESVHFTLILQIRPIPFPKRFARNLNAKSPPIIQSGSASVGSLLFTVSML
jgi:hypothetical protein